MAGEIKKVLFSEGTTVTAPTASPIDVSSYADFTEIAAPSTPSAGYVRAYAKTDKKIYIKNSDGTETEIGSGSGSGEKNYITNSSALTAITGWTAVGDLDVARTTTAADLPREYTTAAGIKITADSNTQSVADYIYYDFSLDDVDLSKKLGIKWSQKTTGTYTAGDLAVVITSQADRTTALHTPITTAIPSATGVFQTSFDATTAAALSLVIRATTDMTTDGGIVISDVVVGPGVGQSVPVVDDSKSVTFTGSWSSNTTYTAKETRVGAWAYYQVKVATSGAPTTAELSLTLPTNRTIDTTRLSNTTAGSSNVVPNSAVQIYDYGTAIYAGCVTYTSTTAVSIQYYDDAAGGLLANNPVSQATPMTFANNDTITIHFAVPIAEWAGSGTVNLAQNDVEYAYNTSTSDASNTTSFGNGPSGNTFPSTQTAGRDRRVRFQSPIQSTDQITVEISEDRIKWVAASSGFVGSTLNVSPWSSTTGIGVRAATINSTDVDIYFSQYAAGASNWSTTSGYWRVKKSSGGQAVGFNLSDTSSSGLAPSGVFRSGEQGNLALQERASTPTDPTSSSEAKIYLKADKLVLQFNDAGTVRYKYLDLTGTGVTWVHTTSAP